MDAERQSFQTAGGGGDSFRFGDVRVEPASFRVWKGGRAVALEPKAFEVLLFLIQNRGRLVRKTELLDAVWADAFVTENALTREIALLRKTLGDEARNARYIETVPRRGYRFIAEVNAAESPTALPERDAAQANSETQTNSETRTSLGTRLNSKPQTDPEARASSQPAVAADPALSPVADSARASFAYSASSSAAERPRRTRLLAASLAFAGLGAFVLAWAVMLKGTPAGRAPAAVRKLTQVTTSVGLDFYPALSPDGNRIAYSSDQSGDFEIYVRQLAPGGREIQVTADGAQNVQPAWSPDGQFVAFHSRRRGGVWIVPALGGVARRLTSFGSRPAWSRDGERVAFQSAELTDLSGLAAGALPPSTIWIAPARGGDARQLTRAGQPPGGHGAPVWSPDGRRVVFYSYDTNMAEIWSVTADAGEPTKAGPGGHLLQLAQNAQPFTDCVYAPDGKFAYCAGIFDATYGLWRVPVSGDTGGPAGEPVKIEGTGATPIRYLSISADGRRIAYSTQSLTSDIWSIAVSTRDGSAAGAPVPLFEDRSLRKTNPSFSPDGRRIAFGVWRLGTPTNVWLMDADGRNAAPLTAEQSGVALPGWMPDGARVTFVSTRQGGPKIWVKDLGSGEERPVYDLDPAMSFHRFSPDGRRLAYNSRADANTVNVWAASLDGGRPARLTSDAEMAGFPCWSPDGRRLAFEFKRGADTHIAVMPADGGPPVQLTSAPGQSWPHSWSPGGDKIAFAGSRDGRWNVWWVAADGRAQKQLTNFTRPNAYVRYPAWSPRGDQIVFEYAEVRGNVWLLDLQ